jgi:hypothetical protein
MSACVLAACALAFGAGVFLPIRRSVQGDLRDLASIGFPFGAALAFLAGWVQWGIRRRKRSDGTLFGRHSRIGTTAANDLFVGCLLLGAVAYTVAPISQLPVVTSAVMCWTLFSGIDRGVNSRSGLVGPFAQIMLAVVGMATLGLARHGALSLIAGRRPVWVDIAFIVIPLIPAAVPAAYAANAHADDLLRGAQATPDGLA